MISAFKWFALLPLWLARGIGFGLGWLIWALSPRYRQVMRANWDQACQSGAFGPAMAAHSRRSRRAFRDAIGHAGLIATELPKIWCDQDAVHRVRATGIEKVQALTAQGRSIVFLTPHLGAFELSSRWYAQHGPITVLYRPSRNALFRKAMETLRPMPNMGTAPASAAGVRQLIRALRRGEAVGMLPDQVPSFGDGVWAPFFGKPAYTMTLPIKLAQAGNAAIVWVLSVRTAHGWHIAFEPWQQSDAVVQMELQDAIAAMNAALQAWIAKAPEQYLWAYNRYKVPRGAAASRPSNG